MALSVSVKGLAERHAVALRIAFTEMLGVEHPIALAPMGGTAGGALAAAVSNGGGLGLVGGGRGHWVWLRRELDVVAAETGPLAEPVIDAGVPLIVQVTDLAEVARALEVGADVLVAQGAEAGGHGVVHPDAVRPWTPPRSNTRRSATGISSTSTPGCLGGLRRPWCDGLRPVVDRLEISRDIAASPEAVYAAISDVTRMGEWSEECYACDWHDGFDGPVVGATFDGHNRHGDHEWTSQGKVIEARPGQAFAFECSMMDFHYSTWGYLIEPTDTGCRVTEWNEDLRPESVMELSKQISGVDDRIERNRQTMSVTLERLAAALET